MMLKNNRHLIAVARIPIAMVRQWNFDHIAQRSPCVAMLTMSKWWLLKMIRSWYLKKNYENNFDKMKVCKSGFVKMQWRCYCKVLWWHMKGVIATGQGKGWQVPFHPPFSVSGHWSPRWDCFHSLGGFLTLFLLQNNFLDIEALEEIARLYHPRFLSRIDVIYVGVPDKGTFP